MAKKAAAKVVPKSATKTKQGAKITKDKVALTVKGKKKVAKAEIKPLAVAAQKNKKTNAMLVKAQIKAGRLKAKMDILKKQIQTLDSPWVLTPE